MRTLWRAQSNPVALWWRFLTLASGANIIFWVLLYRSLHDAAAGSASAVHAQTGSMLMLCAAYVFGCAFRSVLPRADVQRICLYDSFLSSVIVGRSVATVAELCFVAQWAMILNQLGTLAGAETTLNAALVILPLIVIAEICSWYAVLTTNFLFNAIENSLWAVAFLIVGVGLGRLLPEFEGVVRYLLVAGIIGIACYLAFLVVIDVPMYLNRWRAGLAEGSKYLHPLEGLRDTATRWIVTHEFDHWKEEIVWMSLYFTAAVWASLALCVVSAMDDRLLHYRPPSVAASPAIAQPVSTR
jgi:hypothetical protein